MKHVTIGDKALLVGDDTADAVLEYARVIGDAGTADTVAIRAIGPDGNTVEVGLLSNQAQVSSSKRPILSFRRLTTMTWWQKSETALRQSLGHRQRNPRTVGWTARTLK
jgi:hypothetical protein